MKIIEGGVTAAKGFEAAATAAEIKYKNRTDMALVYSQVPCVAAGTFTTNVVKAAPVKWEFKPDYDDDIAKEHERYITEHFNGPVFITDWPKDIKAYYMKVNPDNKTVAAVDLVVPQAGELMGGSQREENLDKLLERMDQMGVDKNGIDWYLDTRRYGGCVHSGFGMGFERLLIYLTGVDNIRDVIPYPRTPGNCEY